MHLFDGFAALYPSYEASSFPLDTTVHCALKTHHKRRKRTTPAYETIKYEVDDQILTITLNRPDKLNAFNGTMLRN